MRQEFCIDLFPMNGLVNYYILQLKKNRILKTFNLEFSDIEVWFTDQNSRPLDIEDKINITLVINQSRRHKN